MPSQLEPFKKLLATKKLPGLLVTTPTNLTYLTGTPPHPQEREIVLLVTSKASYLFCSSLIFDQLKHLKHFTVIKLTRRSDLVSQLKKVVIKDNLTKIGFESDDLTHAEFVSLRAKIKTLRLVPTQNLVAELRLIKNQREINHIQKACRVTRQTMTYLGKIIEVGASEKHIAWEAEKFMHQNGADELAFPVIVASGTNSAIPHHTTSDKKIRPADTVLIDLGCKVQNYCSDMTRTFFISSPIPQQKKIAAIVKKAHAAALSTCAQNTPAKKIDADARAVINQAGYAKNFIHSTGHGVGLDIHEAPRLSPQSKNKLQPNMVVSIEPGIYLPGEFGYRHEDTILITKTKPKNLTA